jgi:hypothetical protein
MLLARVTRESTRSHINPWDHGRAVQVSVTLIWGTPAPWLALPRLWTLVSEAVHLVVAQCHLQASSIPRPSREDPTEAQTYIWARCAPALSRDAAGDD